MHYLQAVLASLMYPCAYVIGAIYLTAPHQNSPPQNLGVAP